MTMKRVLEITDAQARRLRIEAAQNSTMMSVMIGRLRVTLNPADQLELWHFLNMNKSPVPEPSKKTEK